MNNTHAVPIATMSWPLGRVLAAVAGAVFVALSAQVAVPLPGTPVPITLQVAAVLIVGGLLGPRLGAASMAVYLLAGVAGLPVFSPGGALGVARLIGPTGGYLLAFPVAAAMAGWLARPTVTQPHSPTRVALGVVAGFVLIHLGGIAQLAIITGDVTTAFLWGSLPFLAGDLIKLLFAGLIVWRFGPNTRARL
jgi:biotin transport system substrate-specific component